MKAKKLHGREAATYALIFDKADDPVEELLAFAKGHDIGAAHFTAIGAFSEVTLGYFDRARKDYKKIWLPEQVEVLSLTGDIAREDAAPKVHAHVVVGKADGTAHGGHLLHARVWPTLELILTESPKELARRSDSESGLALIDLDAHDSRRAA
jgi:predicted DNA-binding protein with PD1-like motif